MVTSSNFVGEQKREESGKRKLIPKTFPHVLIKGIEPVIPLKTRL